MIRVPKDLSQYIDYDDGKIISKDLPPELEEDFEKFKESIEKLKEENPFTDY